MKILDFFKTGEKKMRMGDMVLIETTNRVYLKRLALNICINYIARTIANSEFRVMNDKRVNRDTLYHKLNVRPNTDSSASDFWQRFVYKLIHENEVLVIKTDTEDLVIADSFNRETYALYEDVFTDVMIEDYTYQRSFAMGDVLYLNYNNERLSSFIDELYSDYGKLFGQMLENSMRFNQFRGVFKFKDGGTADDETFNRQQKQVSRLREIFENNSVALAPLSEGIELENLTNSSAQRDESINNLVKLKRDLIDDVAKILGIPVNLIHGDTADLQNTMEAYINFCINPLSKMISDELNAKLFEVHEYLNGQHITIYGINRIDPLRNATAGDKLVSSGVYSRNEVREKFGDERVDDPEMDKFLITRNYQHADEDDETDEANLIDYDEGGENE